MPKALVIDTESTGFNNPQIIEYAAIAIDDKFNRDLSLQSVNQRYKPSVPIEDGAAAAHHILMSDLEGCPPSETFKPIEAEYMIGHNIDFDWELIGKPECKRICTLAMTRDLFDDGKHNLSATMYRLFGQTKETRDMLRDAHSALADVTMCYMILLVLIDEYKKRGAYINNLEDLYNVSQNARIPKKMTFGKHVGLTFDNIPADYLQWMLRQDMDQYVLVAARQSLQKRGFRV